MSRTTHFPARLLAAVAFLFFFGCSTYLLLSPYYYAAPNHDPVLLAATVPHSSAVIQEESVHGRYLSRPHTKWWPQQPHQAVLFQDWEVLLLLPPDPASETEAGPDGGVGGRGLACLFQDGSVSPASPSGVLPWSRNSIRRCVMPPKARRSLPFLVPRLISDDSATDSVHHEKLLEDEGTVPKELLRWNHLVYESLSTDTDVIVFAKGINNRQGFSRQPGELRCAFYPAGGSPASSPGVVRTPVTSSSQEVFRCGHPDPLDHPSSGLESPSEMTVTLEYTGTGRAIPSIARYQGRRRQSPQQGNDDSNPEGEKSLICTCTMGYNIAKFLPEWTTYHASIGVDRFFIYDNGSEDDLPAAVSTLRDKQGVNITSYLWPWPKTQEAGFSHCAALHRESCTWMMYVDVDEFVFSPSWKSSPQPARGMLSSLLPASKTNSNTSSDGEGDGNPIGQVMIDCYEFGPSGQTSHPPSGVTQGYTCRRRAEERHKSLVRLDAVDPSLLNVVHHFKLSAGFSSRRIRPPAAAVNHYKYQAWPEFRNKFRRRVSAYVVDWTQAVNSASKDRAPGLGFEAVEPEGWPGSFCEVKDNRLKELARKWFSSADDDRLVWEVMM